MDLRYHFWASVVLVGVLYPFMGLHGVWAFVGAFLIDTDHYLYYAVKSKSWSLKKAYDFHVDKRKFAKNYVLHIFHTGEFILFMIIMSIIIYNKKVLFLMFSVTLLGMVIHLTMDYMEMRKGKKWGIRAVWLTEWIARRRR